MLKLYFIKSVSYALLSLYQKSMLYDDDTKLLSRINKVSMISKKIKNCNKQLMNLAKFHGALTLLQCVLFVCFFRFVFCFSEVCCLWSDALD